MLVDDTLPDAKDFEAISRLRELIGDRQVPVVMLSGRNDDAMIEGAFQAGPATTS